LTLGQLLAERAAQFPEAPALKSPSCSFTFREYDLATNRLANWLAQQGVEYQDRVGLLIPNSCEFLVAYYACAKLGAVAMPISPLLHPEEVRFLLEDAEAKALLAYAPLLEKLLAAKALPEGVQLVASQPQVEGTADFAAALKDASLNAPPENLHKVTPDDLAAFMYTSGTTGKPKAAMLTHDNLIFDAQAAVSFIEMTAEDVFLCILPLFHSFAVNVCGICPVIAGALTVIHPRFSPYEVFKALTEERVSIMPAVPAMLGALLEKQPPRETFQHLRLVVSGGAPLPVALFEAYKQRYGVEILEGDGPTEASPITAVNPLHGPKKPGSIGLPLPGVEMRIVDEEDTPLPPGEIGEIVVRGRNVMKGYWKQPEATAETLRNGWLHTGDLGKQDEDGYFYIVDRKKDMLLSAGLNVYPREIEEVLYRHPAVREVAVIGQYDKRRGEVPVAVVSLQEGLEASERDLQDFCRANLAKYKVPRRVIFLEALPRTSTGKINKRLLRKELELSRQS